MSEISLDDPPSHLPGQPPLLARPPVQNISVWVEKFSVMAALLASRFPEKAPELCLPGFRCPGRTQLRQPAVGRVRSLLPPRGSGSEELGLVCAYIMKPSRDMRGQCIAARFASRRTMSPKPAHGTLIDPGLAGSPPRLTPSRPPTTGRGPLA